MIKAAFRNIGPIKKAALELGDLTVIAGQNNTGKTYLVYTLYGFLEFSRERWLSSALLEHEVFDQIMADEVIRGACRRIRNTGSAKMGVEEYRRISKQLIKNVSSFFSSELLHQVFSSPDGEFENALFELETDDGDITGSTVSGNHREQKFTLVSAPDDDAITIRFQKQEDIQMSLPLITKGVVLLFWSMARKNWPNPFILSAERFGISLFYKELDFTKNRLVEELQKLSDEKQFDPFEFLGRESARYAKPIKDNIDFTRDLSRIQKGRSDLPADEGRSISKMMEGYYRAKNNEIRFISTKRKNNRFDIPLHLASSSARGISDLYFYLKHIAQPGQLLVIDEPESHLSPSNQVMMARLLVLCVNSGLKVLVTTHSDYLIKEINNLIMLNGDFRGKTDFLRRNKKDYSENDRLDPESVKAYICEGGKLTSCAVDTTGIDMPIFDEAIDNINKISMELTLHTAQDDLQPDRSHKAMSEGSVLDEPCERRGKVKGCLGSPSDTTVRQ